MSLLPINPQKSYFPHSLRLQRISLDDAKRPRKCAHDVKPAVNALWGLASCPAGIIEMLADQEGKRERVEPDIRFFLEDERYR